LIVNIIVKKSQNSFSNKEFVIKPNDKKLKHKSQNKEPTELEYSLNHSLEMNSIDKRTSNNSKNEPIKEVNVFYPNDAKYTSIDQFGNQHDNEYIKTIELNLIKSGSNKDNLNSNSNYLSNFSSNKENINMILLKHEESYNNFLKSKL